ncbi:MAG: hypothetical protein ABGZ37_00775, partial [Akkermansiaceae bacterium]
PEAPWNQSYYGIRPLAAREGANRPIDRFRARFRQSYTLGDAPGARTGPDARRLQFSSMASQFGVNKFASLFPEQESGRI